MLQIINTHMQNMQISVFSCSLYFQNKQRCLDQRWADEEGLASLSAAGGLSSVWVLLLSDQCVLWLLITHGLNPSCNYRHSVPSDESVTLWRSEVWHLSLSRTECVWVNGGADVWKAVIWAWEQRNMGRVCGLLQSLFMFKCFMKSVSFTCSWSRRNHLCTSGKVWLSSQK